MKKMLLLAVAAAMVGLLSGCGSLRTPSGPNNKKIWYNTFFGLSIESVVNGDSFLVNQK